MLTPDDEQHILKLHARLSGTVSYLEEQNNALTVEVQRLRVELDEANVMLAELRPSDGPAAAEADGGRTPSAREGGPSA